MLRGLGPAMPRPSGAEIARAALGAALGLMVTDLVLWAIGGAQPGGLSRLWLVAPFGASAYLVFSLPGSPLAQPWSVMAGNGLSAAAAMAVLTLGLPPLPSMGLAVILAMAAMGLARAMHPPGGAVALATVLLAAPGATMPGPGFVLHPVLSGSACLVACAVLWNRLTGREYPAAPPAAAPAPVPPARRVQPGPLALASALGRLRLGAHLGVEDLARLIEAAETTATALDRGPLTAAHLMSRDLTTLGPDTGPAEAAQVFRRTGFRHLPLATDGAYLGLVPQTALLGPLPDLTLQALAEHPQAVGPETPLADLLALMATGRQICIPVVDKGRLQGLITRTDLLAALSHGPVSH